MENKKSFLEKYFIPCMVLLLILQLCAAFWFCVQKQGFHYDEYYSYYSSNVTYALVPTDMEWKDTAEIRSEFMVLPDAGLGYGMVRLMQSLDVHPPLYYYILHTICGMSKGIFSKWQGLSINLVFFVLSWMTLWGITRELTGNDKKKIFAVCALFGFSPAVFSGITFIRMYMMLTSECLLLLYVHIRAIMRQKRKFTGFYLPVFLLAFAGFHTHYYFAVFLFFAAAVTSLYLFFHKKTRGASFVYAGFVLGGMLLSVVAYPACLSHIFRGYRGTEAQDAFFDMGNIFDRLSFFYELTDEYAFGNMLSVLILVPLLLGVTKRALKNMKEAAYGKTVEKTNEAADAAMGNELWSPYKKATLFTGCVTGGYFLVVAKTALLNAEEAIRYEMPVYGLFVLLIVLILDHQLAFFKNKSNEKYIGIIFVCLMTLTLVGEIAGLARQKVCFLYPEDAVNVAWAKEHSTEAVVYIYNQDKQWMIWDDSEELMQYEQIYFVSGSHEGVETDGRLSLADTVYVYKMRGDAPDVMFEQLVAANGGFSEITLIRELLYCDLYELER